MDNHYLFEHFQGRKELEQRLEGEANKRKAVLDSISLQIQALMPVAHIGEDNPQKLRALQGHYQRLSQEHQGMYQQKSQEYTEAIWKQISQYAQEYGEQEGYDYVFGIAGQGSLMYGKQYYDITKEVATYINSKYAGN